MILNKGFDLVTGLCLKAPPGAAFIAAQHGIGNIKLVVSCLAAA
jgi:hypothetical protein